MSAIFSLFFIQGENRIRPTFIVEIQASLATRETVNGKMVHPDRVQIIKESSVGSGPVVYWMSRDQRAEDNWALIYAWSLAAERDVPVIVLFCLVPSFLGATLRQYGFMLRGLKETAESLRKINIPFHLIQGSPGDAIPPFLEKVQAGAFVMDFDPLMIKRAWQQDVCERSQIPSFLIDAHNIVPCWKASGKQEFGAYTIRPKIHRLIDAFLEPFPVLAPHPVAPSHFPNFPNPEKLMASLDLDQSVPEITDIPPGSKAGRALLDDFIQNRLPGYAADRNDPNRTGQSGLSPYLHFGQIAPQRAALEVVNADPASESSLAFLEELIVRRELSDNFCFYQPDYDSFAGAPDWARKTLDEHREDRREFIYSLEEFEAGRTHDALWNAAQNQMAATGKMHGFLRMYWAKKVLEWTPDPETAWRIAIYLNDKYSLDGRDPNGYTGIAWSLGGVHDRAWGARPVFGKIRYMSEAGCRRKFDVDKYIRCVL
ncbi:MAG: deoxyribodipyrimidine photo-lyase [Syntrophaceae bacterium]|nr:deoxyribodipyrimidine photo-lyase [Syntrophaceae bacterium]